MIVAWALKVLGWLKVVPWQIWAAVALFFAFWLWGEHRHSAGYNQRVKEEAEEQRQAEEEQERKRIEAERGDKKTKNSGDKAIADRRKDLDDAKANLPDQGLTARQRARACAELRRQGKVCPPAPTAP